MNIFKGLGLSDRLVQELDKNQFTQPTEIQEKAIPILLSHDTDFHGQAQTGTGKTLAFGLPLLDKINVSNSEVQALIVAPTRELVLQICESLEKFTPALGVKIDSVYGGVSMERQLRMLRKGGVHIIVGTPGRLNDHLRRGTLKLKSLATLVLDEADIMLDMGFKEEVDEILTFTSSDRKIWLFSATIKGGIENLKRQHMNNTQSVAASKQAVAAPNTKQYVCVTPMRSRFDVLRRFVDSEPNFYGFIFCPTKVMTADIGQKLSEAGYSAGSLHGDMNQSQRTEVIKKFKNKQYSILVATDVAARGIDVSLASHVINYCLPDDQESYIHRIGRTGRAGNEGTAITFIGSRDLKRFSDIKRKFKLKVDPISVPSYEQVCEARIKQAQKFLDGLACEEEKQSHDGLEQFVAALSSDQLKKIAFNVAHQRFMKHLPQDRNIESTPANRVSLEGFDVKEILIPVGSEDRVRKDDVITFLTSSGVLDQDQIQKIRVIKRRTFVEVPAKLVTSLVSSLKFKKLRNRSVRMKVLHN